MSHSSATSRQLLGQALALHQAGKRPQAEAIYRQMLNANPRDANALRLLGVLQFESGQTAAALDLISRAIAISPNVADYHFSLAGILQAIGQHDGATASYRRAVEIYPKFPQAWFNLGNLLRARQQNTQAIAAYRQALAAQPNYPEAANNLGIALAAAGDHQGAITSYRQAMGARPNFAEAANNMAESLDAVGQFDLAVAACQVALQNRPNFAEAYAHLGNTYMHKNDPQQAIAAYRRALSLRPDLADVHRNLGDALRETEQLDEAIAAYQQAIKLRPKFPEAYLNLGNALAAKGQSDQAIEGYRHAIGLRKDFLPAEQNLGMVLTKKGRHVEALTAFGRVAALTPDDAGAHSNLANALRETGQIKAAIAAYEQAIAVDPTSPLAYSNLSATLWKVEKFDQSLEMIEKAIALHPTFVEAFINQAFVLMGFCRIDEAVEALHKALAIRQDSALAHLCLGISYLLRGQWKVGWPEYEWRQECPEVNSTMRRVPGLQWDGSDLSGKTIFLADEQGFGDSIQFVRYIPLIAARGGRIILETKTGLMRLFGGVKDVELVPRGQEIPPYDVYSFTMSLPLIFGTEPATIPAPIPYLRADAELSETWGNKLGPKRSEGGEIRVGLTWAGSPGFAHDYKRSLSLAELAVLAKIPHVSFYSLQKGEAGRQTNPPAMQLIDFTPDLGDFADTAAFIDNLDLVISVDTAVAHLSGAMGKPTWIMLPFSPDWRWLLGRDDTNWYPTARLFRQPALGDWAGVVSAVAEELYRLVAGKYPDDAEVQYQLGVYLGQNGQFDQAVTAFTRATALKPDHADAQNSLGIALIETGRPAEAVAACQRAVARCPTAAKAHCNLAAALAKDNQLDAALDAARKAAELEPNFVGAWVNVGLCFSYLGQLDQALAAYRRALAIESFPLAHWDLACALLALGDFQEGFREYEWRVAAKQIPQRQFSQPRWQGGPIPAGRSRPPRIFITQEQGLGDAIQFARFIPQVAQLGANVIVECELALARLFRTIPGVQAVASPGQPMPDFDSHCPLPSLPLALGTSLQNLPAKVPYLRVEPALIADWQRRLEDAMGGSAIAKAGRKIGLVWAGNAKPDPARTAGLAAFAPLAGVRGASFISLQLGRGSEEASDPPAGMRLIDLTNQIDDLADTAALIAHLDLVITIDSAVAHLAGALGKPVWVFLPFCPDWRWMRDRDDSPWYPTARLFRQTKPGDWRDPVARAAAALAKQKSGLA
jgi:tetratricopeptide (TPR) repeat protein